MMLRLPCFRVIAPPLLWTNYKKSTFAQIGVAFNNAYRKIFGLRKKSSAGAMYENHNICSFETMLKNDIFMI